MCGRDSAAKCFGIAQNLVNVVVKGQVAALSCQHLSSALKGLERKLIASLCGCLQNHLGASMKSLERLANWANHPSKLSDFLACSKHFSFSSTIVPCKPSYRSLHLLGIEDPNDFCDKASWLGETFATGLAGSVPLCRQDGHQSQKAQKRPHPCVGLDERTSRAHAHRFFEDTEVFWQIVLIQNKYRYIYISIYLYNIYILCVCLWWFYTYVLLNSSGFGCSLHRHCQTSVVFCRNVYHYPFPVQTELCLPSQDSNRFDFFGSPAWGCCRNTHKH